MHRWRRHPEIALHVSFRRREAVDLRVVVDEGEVLALLRRVARLRMFGLPKTFHEPVRQSGTLPNREFQRFGFELFRGQAQGFKPWQSLTAKARLADIVPRVTDHPGLWNSSRTRNPRCP
jgi:hypothetical protein